MHVSVTLIEISTREGIGKRGSSGKVGQEAGRRKETVEEKEGEAGRRKEAKKKIDQEGKRKKRQSGERGKD